MDEDEVKWWNEARKSSDADHAGGEEFRHEHPRIRAIA